MWFVYALGFAFFTSIPPFLSKKLTNQFPALFVLYIGLFLQVILLGIVLSFFGKVPSTSQSFFQNIIFAAAIDAIAFAAAIEAIKRSPISLITPLGAFSPVFTMLFAAILLKEIPGTVKLLGILLIVIGAYSLNFDKIRSGYLAPIKELILHRGAQLFFLANILWGITPIFQKNALLATNPVSPVYTNFIGYSLSFLLLLPFAIPGLASNIGKLKPHLKIFFIIGILNTLSGLAGLIAFGEGNVSYATAIFKLSSIFTIAWGGLFLNEKHIKERVVGAGIMLTGTLFLLL